MPAGAAGQVKLSWGTRRVRRHASAPPTSAPTARRQIGLGYVHDLSKRTALYATLSRIDNDGALTLAVPGGSGGMTAGGSFQGL